MKRTEYDTVVFTCIRNLKLGRRLKIAGIGAIIAGILVERSKRKYLLACNDDGIDAIDEIYDTLDEELES